MSQRGKETRTQIVVEGPSRRILMKLSGEAFGGGPVGLDPDVVLGIAHQVAIAVSNGIQITIVVVGGNSFRGTELSQRSLGRARVGYMKMFGTAMNALTLQDFLE